MLNVTEVVEKTAGKIRTMHESRGLQQGEVVFYQHSLCINFH